MCDYANSLCVPKTLLKKIIAEAATSNELIQMHGLIDEFTLAEFELTCNTKEIWLISSDFSVESTDNIFQSIVEKNLRRGISYTLFALDTKIARDRAVRIQNMYSHIKRRGKISVKFIDPKDAKLVFMMYNFAIYNPLHTQGMDQTAIICFGENDDTVRSIYRRLPRDAGNSICETVKAYK